MHVFVCVTVERDAHMESKIPANDLRFMYIQVKMCGVRVFVCMKSNCACACVVRG